MSIFRIIPHPKYPDQYDLCNETGVCFFKHAKNREYSSSYFMEELLALLDNKYNNITVLNVHLELLNDCANLISQEMIYRSKNPKILQFLMSFSLY